VTVEPPAAFGRYRGALDERLRSLLSDGLPAGSHPEELHRMLRYHLGWEDAEGRAVPPASGKALRPTLCLLACEAAGGDWRAALPAAAAIELVHNFSLVHDDIQDRDAERRHRPAVWSVWGEAQAINAGDALLTLARLAVLGLGDEGVAVQRVLEAARVLDERTLEMVEGQALDIGFEERLDVSEAEYLEMIGKKTGALFDCALRLGGLVGADDPTVAAALGRCGRALGVAFQIRDDMLGVWGAESRTGKPPAADIRNRKKSLPVVYAFARAEGGTAAELRRVYSQPRLTDADVSVVLGALESVRAQAYCRTAAEERRERALAELAGADLRRGPAAELRQVADFLLERDY
jgi:geranylgeranyl diphosphate synthase type I